MADLLTIFVTFLPIGSTDHVFLTLTGDWTITGGLEANVNCAEIPYTERSKLPTNLVYVNGTVFFWDTDEIGEGTGTDPLHVLGNQWLVDCSAGHIGRVPGDTVDRILSYRLAFADHRSAFRPPRGGRLTQGLGNPDPLGDADLIQNDDLIGACLSAMGVSASVPPSVNAVDPPRNIEWFGAHAPSELNTLLQQTGHVYCPYSGGGATITPLGYGGLPTIPAGRLNSSVAASAVNRLPLTAIFTSAPNAVARTYNQDAGDDGPAWEFVVMNPADNYKWTSIDALGDDPLYQLQRGFPDAPEQDRDLLSSQFYKCIRLKGDRFNTLQSPILRDVLYPDGRVDVPHLVATIAVQGRDNAWVNTQVRVNASTVDGVGNILVFEKRLGTVTGGDERADLDPFFEPLEASALKPTFTVEDWNEEDGKLLAVYGFVIGVGVGEISEDAARGLLRGFNPATAIYDMPELHFVWLNDDDNNGNELKASALSMATALLVTSPTCSTVEVTGILPCEIDGRVSEVTYSQQGLQTTITLDGWSTASRGRHSRRHRGSHVDAGGGPGGGLSGDLISQPFRSHAVARQRSQAQQISRGGHLARQASPASLVPAERTGSRRVGVVPTAPVDGETNRYKGTSRSGKFDKAATGAFTVANVGAAGTADDCIVWSSSPLSLGQLYFGDAGPVTDDGKLIVYVTALVRSRPTEKYQVEMAIDDTLELVWTRLRVQV